MIAVTATETTLIMNTKRELNIMIASPGDVATERQAVRATIARLNGVLADRLGFVIQLRSWETDVYPGFHPEGPQGLIDSKLHIEDYDAVIVVMWCRFGTPTHESQSGTEHEFKRAFQAWEKNGTPQIFCYFNSAPCNPRTKDEIVQLGQVLQFKEGFPKPGMWSEYNGPTDFTRVIDDDLTNFLLDVWQHSKSATTDEGLPRSSFLPAALLALQGPLGSYLELLFSMYKAAAPIQQTFGSVHAFLSSPSFSQELRFLDFSKPAPVTSPLSWGQWVGSQHHKFLEAIDRVMNRYAHSLPPDLAYSIEHLSKSMVTSIVYQLAVNGAEVHPCWLYNASDVISKDAGVLEEVIAKYNTAADPENQILLEEQQLWRSDIAPGVGSGRFAGPI